MKGLVRTMSTPHASTMPLIPAAWGEIIDKITILEIKSARISAEPAQANIRRELGELIGIAAAQLRPGDDIAALRDALRAVNETLWDVEDRLRDKERLQDFGPDFVALARSVYRLNDQRAALKRKINLQTASVVVEEKSYRDY